MANRKVEPFEEFDSFEQVFEQAEQRPGYWAERAKLEFTREVFERMEEGGISKSELANRLEVRPGAVTKLLSGRNNFEIETMCRIAMALNCRYRSHLQPQGANTVWYDISNTEGGSLVLDNLKAVEFTSAIAKFIPTMECVNYAPSSIAA